MVKKKKQRSPRIILVEKVQKLANKYARTRDCIEDGGTFCISCMEWTEFPMMDGGHFIPTTSSDIRFDERNINAQCRKCNRFLKGNYRHYYHGMIAKYGKKIVDELESREKLGHHWTIEELKQLELYYKVKLAELK